MSEKIICFQCKGKFDAPLELYDGRWRCPRCGKDPFSYEMEVTEENQEYFDLSELFFHNYLLAESQSRSDESNRERIKRENFLRQAIEYCRRAAWSGNLHAFLRLGFYYDNNYIDFGRGDADRDVIAFKDYEKVISKAGERIEELRAKDRGGESPEARKERQKLQEESGAVESLRRRAAVAMLGMLSVTSDANAKRKGFDLDKRKEEFLEKGIIDENTAAKFTRKKMPEEDRVQRLYDLFLSFERPQGRSPFFGYCRMSGEEVQRLAVLLENLPPAERKKRKLEVMALKNLNPKTDGPIKLDKTVEMVVSHDASIKKIDKQDEALKNFFVFFFNQNCGEMYGMRAKIDTFIKHFWSTMSMNGKEKELADIMNADMRAECFFYADDLYYVNKKFKKVSEKSNKSTEEPNEGGDHPLLKWKRSK